MSLGVPLSPVPSQTLAIVLDNQNCQISVYTLSTGMYFDLVVNGVTVATTRICVYSNLPAITRLLADEAYSGFVGDFFFYNAQPQATDDDETALVEYTGLGSKFLFIYLEASDL
jgi:hypothetical protein